jgi:hypothetical protein
MLNTSAAAEIEVDKVYVTYSGRAILARTRIGP